MSYFSSIINFFDNEKSAQYNIKSEISIVF
jgi:hypothetical protein